MLQNSGSLLTKHIRVLRQIRKTSNHQMINN
nr:MAG TPA: hypothetical protein [Caudoviricetes sp.]